MSDNEIQLLGKVFVGKKCPGDVAFYVPTMVGPRIDMSLLLGEAVASNATITPLGLAVDPTPGNQGLTMAVYIVCTGDSPVARHLKAPETGKK
jgi:hypothetical protein